jgi:hypothetical protein
MGHGPLGVMYPESLESWLSGANPGERNAIPSEVDGRAAASSWGVGQRLLHDPACPQCGASVDDTTACGDSGRSCGGWGWESRTASMLGWCTNKLELLVRAGVGW